MVLGSLASTTLGVRARTGPSGRDADRDARHAVGPVLVTGSAGFIGSHLVRRLRALHYEVLEVRDRADCDLTDFAATRRRIRERVPSAIVHLAASRDVWGATADRQRDVIANTVDATRNLRRALPENARCVIVHAGSYKQYGAGGALPFREWMAPNPTTAYGLAKQTSEQHLLARSTERIQSVCLRIGPVFGPGQPETAIVLRTIRAALAGELDRLVVVKALWDPLFIDDAVDAIIAAVVSPRSRGQVINVSGGVAVPVLSVVKWILSVMSASAEDVDRLTARDHPSQGSLAGDISKARRLLHWGPRVSIADGLRRVVASACADERSRCAGVASGPAAFRRGVVEGP
jgi:UDP-glucose 4-epimerase